MDGTLTTIQQISNGKLPFGLANMNASLVSHQMQLQLMTSSHASQSYSDSEITGNVIRVPLTSEHCHIKLTADDNLLPDVEFAIAQESQYLRIIDPLKQSN
jgi:hypothetical protein